MARDEAAAIESATGLERGGERLRVGLFVTCLVDLFRPSIGLAAVELLERAGCWVDVPAEQTCCGQPAYNGGAREDAAAIARQVIAACEGFDSIVVPSGACAGMIRVHYPRLLGSDPEWSRRAERVAARTHELVSFLVDVRGQTGVDSIAWPGRTTYHDSCSGLRELGIKRQPRQLLGSVTGLEVVELAEAEVCCGFGGTFCVKYAAISERLVADKVRAIVDTGAAMVLAGDLGCLLNIAGRLSREGVTVEVRHVAEVLTGRVDVPAIGQAAGTSARRPGSAG